MVFTRVIPRLFGLDSQGLLNNLISKFFLLAVLRKTTLLFSRAFSILYMLTIVDYQFLGIIFAVAFVFEAFTDYPTGVLSDKVGFRRVLFIAFALWSASFYILAQATTSFELIIVFLIQALASGQESGALQSWFDNNYEKIGESDQERTIYVEFLSKSIIIIDLIGYGVAMFGGYLAITLENGRSSVFLIQAVIAMYVAFILLIFVSNYYVDEIEEAEKGGSYSSHLLEGILFIFKPKIFFLSLGLMASLVVKSTWLSLLIQPIYFAYLKNDFNLSIMNFAVFGAAAVITIWRSKSWKKAEISSTLPVLKSANGVLYFGAMAMLLLYIPPILNEVTIAVLFFAGVISSLFLTQSKVLSYRLLLDVVPNNKRNGYYSALPTFALLIAAGLNYYAGSYIASNGFVDVILLLMVIELAGGLLLAIVLMGVGFRELEKVDHTHDDIPYIFEAGLNDTEKLSKQLRRFKPSVWYLSETTKKIWMRLMNVAQQDKTITDEEMELLVEGMEQLKDYIKTLETALHDGIVRDYEAKFLKEKRDELLNHVVTKAKEDGKVSRDEQALLQLYERILDELQKIELIGH